jgi:DNA-binding transcriptional LysR family regulator
VIPNLTSLTLFLRTLESSSLSKAAFEMNLAVSAASRRVAQLEEQVGIALLVRVPGGGIEPTPAGLAMAAHIKEILRQLDRMSGELRDFKDGLKGHVRLYANVSAMSQQLPRDLADLARRFPDIKLEVHEARSAEILTAVQLGKADVGIVVEEHEFAGLIFAPYRTDTLGVVIPNDHPVHAESVDIADLLGYDFVGFDNNAAITRRLEAFASSLGTPLRLRVIVQSYEAACRMVEAGYGVSVIPISAAITYVRSLPLRLVRLTNDWAVRQMYVCAQQGTLPSARRSVFEYLSQAATSGAKHSEASNMAGRK